MGSAWRMRVLIMMCASFSKIHMCTAIITRQVLVVKCFVKFVKPHRRG